jgi:hypothetical protein
MSATLQIELQRQQWIEALARSAKKRSIIF